MKPLKLLATRVRRLTALLPSAAVLWALPLAAAPPPQPAKGPATNTPPRSVFILPTKPAEGHDPFFPKSNRPYETVVNIATNNIPEVSALMVKGVSGQTVIINNHTFAAGDTADVITEQGRVRVHCVEIKPRSVVVEVNGRYNELPRPDYP
jgi:hypothetical protein